MTRIAPFGFETFSPRGPHLLLLGALLLSSGLASAAPPSPASTSPAVNALLGGHFVTLQWLGWEKPGRVDIGYDGERLRIRGAQENAEGDLIVDGEIREVTARSFVFVGEITTRVTHINEGQPCTRKGVYHFKRTGKRKYWRLREMTTPCGGGTTDYVDVYLKKLKPRPAPSTVSTPKTSAPKPAAPRTDGPPASTKKP